MTLRRGLLLVAAAAAILVLLRWSLEPEPPSEPAPVEAPPRYSLHGVEWVRLDPLGEPEFQVLAASMEYLDDDSIRLSEVQLNTEAGPSGAWHFEARHAFAPPRERRILLFGEVLGAGVLAQGSDVVVETDRLWVDQLRRELHTDERVTVSTEGREAAAMGLRADFSGERLELLRDVQVTYAPRE